MLRLALKNLEKKVNSLLKITLPRLDEQNDYLHVF